MLCFGRKMGTTVSAYASRSLHSVCDERWTAASEGDESGCTLIVALVVDDLVVVANAGQHVRKFSECSVNFLRTLLAPSGDCRAILSSAGESADQHSGSAAMPESVTTYMYSSCSTTEVSTSRHPNLVQERCRIHSQITVRLPRCLTTPDPPPG